MTPLALVVVLGQWYPLEPKEYVPPGYRLEELAGGYAPYFRAMGEAPLPAVTAAGARSFRLSIFPTWGEAVAVRLMADERRLEWRALSGQAGFEVGPVRFLAAFGDGAPLLASRDESGRSGCG